MRTFVLVAALFVLLPLRMQGQDEKKVRDRAQDAIEELESGKLTLRFFNALTGKPVKGGHVSLKDIGEYVTDFDGKVLFDPPAEDGEVAVTFRAAGYITSEFGVEVMNGSLYFNRFSVSPTLTVHQVRIVLDWGEEPRDLDLHFVKDGGYHISYRDMHADQDGAAVLDRDDTHGYGPETITVQDISGVNRYECFVHNYSDRHDDESTTLSRSHATVKLYAEGRLIRVFQVPRTGQGTIWHVFEYVGGAVNDLGTITQ